MLAMLGIGAGVCVAAVLGASPGGVRGSYPARDDDPYLTSVASQALPLIDALEQYRKEHGGYPAAGDAFVAGGMPSGWSYAGDANGYELSKKLGWDPRLAYRRGTDRLGWVFIPGDGGDETVIRLDIGRAAR